MHTVGLQTVNNFKNLYMFLHRGVREASESLKYKGSKHQHLNLENDMH